MSQQQLVRSESDRMIGGVCGGLADYLNIDPVLVRLAFVLLGLASGIGLPIYLILWVVMPSAGSDVSASIVLNDEMPPDPAVLKAGTRNNTALIGGLLVLFGLFFLLNHLGWLGGLFWPLVIIGGGLFFILRRNG